MADTSQTDPEQNQSESSAEGQTDVKPGESQGTVSSTGQEDWNRRLAALEAQLAREHERNESLEQSLRIQERFVQAQQAAQTKPGQTGPDPAWSQEVEVLDKALEPIFNKRLKAVVEPIAQHFGAVRDENDALKFDAFLQRNYPESLETEDAYNQTMQRVEAVRQIARQRGIEVSRVDAFVFDLGLQGTKQAVTARRQRKTNATAGEARRNAEVDAANATSTAGSPRTAANAGIQAIRAKANSGERLTPEEREKYRAFVSNVEI